MNAGYLLTTIDNFRLNNGEAWMGDVSELLASLKELEVLEIEDTTSHYVPTNDIVRPRNRLRSDMFPAIYSHASCSWVPKIISEVEAAEKFDRKLSVWDFPSRNHSDGLDL